MLVPLASAIAPWIGEKAAPPPTPWRMSPASRLVHLPRRAVARVNAASRRVSEGRGGESVEGRTGRVDDRLEEEDDVEAGESAAALGERDDEGEDGAHGTVDGEENGGVEVAEERVEANRPTLRSKRGLARELRRAEARRT